MTGSTAFSTLVRPAHLLGGAALALLLALSAKALDPSRAVNQYTVDAWELKDGLPQNSVLSLVQGDDGYLWLGTYEGLVRFDGVRFTVFTKKDTPALSSNGVLEIAKGSGGELWIGTMDGGLVKVEDGVFTRVSSQVQIPGQYALCLREAQDGGLWIGTYGAGLLKLKEGRCWVVGAPERPRDTTVYGVLEEDDGTLWIGTGGDGLRCLKDGRWSRLTVREGLPDDLVRCLLRTPDGALWVGTAGGLAKIQDGRITTLTRARSGLSGDTVKDLLLDRDGNLWAATELALDRIRDGRVETLWPARHMTDQPLAALAEDREGSVWVGTHGGGLRRVKDGSVTPVTTRQGLATDGTRSFFEDAAGRLWVGTERGLSCYSCSPEPRDLGPVLSTSPIYTIGEDSEGGLWVGTVERGFARVKGGQVRFYGRADGLDDTIVSAIFRDSAGRLWVGTESGVIQWFDGKGFRRTGAVNEVRMSQITSLCETPDGSLWAGTLRHGVARYKDGRFTYFTPKDGLPGEEVITLYAGADGALWIGTYGDGICRYRDGRFASFDCRSGLHDDVAYAILDDTDGHLWISGNRGVYRVSKSDLDDFAEGRTRSYTCLALDESDGMPSSECNGGYQNAGLRTRDGRLWFPTLRGAAVIDPVRIFKNRLPPIVHVEEVRADDAVLPHEDAVVLQPGTRNLEVHYTGISFVAPQKVRFRYWLEGYDTGWQEAGARRVAYYTRIPPGRYTFRVTACNNDGVWNGKGDSFSLEVRPFFYQTRTFLVLCALGLVLAGFGVARFRIRQLKARQRELEALVTARTRDLAEEKERSERLLLNVLPRPIAERLKHDPGTIADSFGEVTVLFADIAGFTTLASRVTPEDLVHFLNGVFSAFDHHAEELGLEKIKTIGDSYMAVAGLPLPREDHAEAAAEMALRMIESAKERSSPDGEPLMLRVGLHTGPVVAGVIGQKKFSYDLWGDTVNIASRMESHGVEGGIQVSEAVALKLAGRYEFRERGVIRLKGLGEMRTYLLLGRTRT